MDGLQCLGHLRRQRQHRLYRQRPPRGHRVVQGRPGDVRRGQPRFVGAQIRVDDRHGVEALHPPGRGALKDDPGPATDRRGLAGFDLRRIETWQSSRLVCVPEARSHSTRAGTHGSSRG
ncbi:hypothetical protein [Streptomyces sp. NPDC001750]|uniref:hypothetical protein n=1 Tax=unclassified Streptomyces TaxID=2593676 RepID=UPI003690348C